MPESIPPEKRQVFEALLKKNGIVHCLLLDDDAVYEQSLPAHPFSFVVRFRPDREAPALDLAGLNGRRGFRTLGQTTMFYTEDMLAYNCKASTDAEKQSIAEELIRTAEVVYDQESNNEAAVPAVSPLNAAARADDVEGKEDNGEEMPKVAAIFQP